MWIHEGFTMYSESLFVEYYYGKEAGAEYTKGIRMNISNTSPMIGDYDVNGSGADMYNKGNNMLHTLRQIVNDDEKWRAMLRGLNKEFYHQTVTTKQIEEYIASNLGLKLDAFFNQYLRDIRIPVFEYAIRDGKLSYHWTNCIRGFDMPVKVWINGKEVILKPTRQTKSEKLESDNTTLTVDSNYYVYNFNTLGDK